MMVSARLAVFALAVFSLICMARCCDPQNSHNGCKFTGTSCECGYGCITEYPYKTKHDCIAAYRERNDNVCSRSPCLRGNCLQVNKPPGYACRCEGTGFYGQRCEKACPTVPVRGYAFPLECIVI